MDAAPAAMSAPAPAMGMDLFSLAAPSANFVAPPVVILKAAQAKGLEVSATFARRNRTIQMDLSFSNRSMMVSVASSL